MVNEVIVGEIVVTVIAVGLPVILNFVFKWSKRHGISVDKEQEKYIIDAATNGALDVWGEYTSNIKRYSIDGKLSDDEKKKARDDAIRKAKSLITDEVKKAYKRGDIDKLIEGAMEKVFSDIKDRKGKEKSPDVKNANKEVLEAVHMALKISMKKYMSELKKSIDEGKFERAKTKEIVGEVFEISKNFINEKIVDRINKNKAGNKDRLNKIILREMYKMMLSEEGPRIS